MQTKRMLSLLTGLCCSLTLVNCSGPTGQGIVLKSVDFHGGIQKWEQKEGFAYTKHTLLYEADGSIEVDVTAEYMHELVPAFKSSKAWSVDDTIHFYALTGNKENDLKNFEDEASYNKAKADLDGAYFVIQQPYKLLENAAQLEYLGQEALDDSTNVDIVKLQYYNEDGSKDNTWWFYFNASDHRMEGYLVKHDSTYAYIRGETFEDITGLSLHKTRTSYRVDSLRNIQYVRGKYRYDFTK